MAESKSKTSVLIQGLPETTTLGELKERYAAVFREGATDLIDKAMEGRTEFSRFRRDTLVEAENFIRAVAEYIRSGAPELPKNDQLLELGARRQQETLLSKGWSEAFVFFSEAKFDYEDFASYEAALEVSKSNPQNGEPFRVFRRTNPDTGEVEFRRAISE